MRFLTLVVLVFFACVGCSKDQAKRAAFETLQNIKSQRCDDRLIDGCEESENFDTYQRQRQEVLDQVE